MYIKKDKCAFPPETTGGKAHFSGFFVRSIPLEMEGTHTWVILVTTFLCRMENNVYFSSRIL